MIKRAIASLLVLVAFMACGGGPSPTPTTTTSPTPTSPTTWPGVFRNLKPTASASIQGASLAAPATATDGSTTMSSKRANHTATQIPDGRIVIIGGSSVGSASGWASTIDIFNPSTERFTTANTTLSIPRIDAQAVLLGDGRIALIGGGGTSSIDVYDPVSDTMSWDVMSFESERREFKAISVGDPYILVFGGVDNNDAMRPPVLIDTTNWTQKVLATDPYLFRTYFGFTLLKSGKVAISGGLAGATKASGVPSSNVILFDPATEAFQIAGSMREAREGHTTLELADGTLGIYGGIWQTSTETFDFATSTSTYGGNLISTKSFMLSAQLQNGFTLHCGGKTGNVVTNTQMVYDPSSQKSGYTSNMLTSRRDFTLTVMPNGCYLVTGGQDEAGNCFDSAEVFDPQAEVTITYPSAAIPYTESVQLTPSGDTTGLVWSCDVGSIDQNGLYKAPELSSSAVVAYITATNAKGKSAIVHVAFTRDIIQIVGSTTVPKDSTNNTYSAGVNWYSNNTVTWTTDKGTISSSGVLDVTGLASGDVVTITATLVANTQYTATLAVTVQ